ncbi:MAG: peptidylprolyl isomerase [Pseudomonadota bacterium]
MVKFGPRAMVLGGFFAVFPGLASGALAQAPKPLDVAADPVVAAVGDQPIYRSDVLAVHRTLPAQFQQVPIEVLFPAVVERLIDAKLIAAAGRKEGLDQDAAVQRRIAQFAERVIQEVYLNRRLEAGLNENGIRRRYEQFVKDNPAKEQIGARHILVRTEVEAREVIAELKGGADFANLAKAKSIDPTGKQQGGELGYFSRDEMVAEFSEAAFRLKDGETTQTPVRTQFGWHVIMVIGRRSAAPPLEEVREQLVSQMSQDIMNETVAKLREGASIERFNFDGSARN